MLISELIEALQEIQNAHGDLQVDVVDTSLTCDYALEIQDIEYLDADDSANIFLKVKDS